MQQLAILELVPVHFQFRSVRPPVRPSRAAVFARTFARVLFLRGRKRLRASPFEQGKLLVTPLPLHLFGWQLGMLEGK